MNDQFKKDGGEDDPGAASRGNWWQGMEFYFLFSNLTGVHIYVAMVLN